MCQLGQRSRFICPFGPFAGVTGTSFFVFLDDIQELGVPVGSHVKVFVPRSRRFGASHLHDRLRRWWRHPRFKIVSAEHDCQLAEQVGKRAPLVRICTTGAQHKNKVNPKCIRRQCERKQLGDAVYFLARATSQHADKPAGCRVGDEVEGGGDGIRSGSLVSQQSNMTTASFAGTFFGIGGVCPWASALYTAGFGMPTYGMAPAVKHLQHAQQCTR